MGWKRISRTPAGRSHRTRPSCVGERGQGRPAVGRQPCDGELRQRRDEPRERLAARDGPLFGPSVQPEDRVPAAVVGEVPGEHEEAVRERLIPIEEPQHPDLRVEDVARPGGSHLVDGVFEQRHEIGGPSSRADRAGLAENVEPFAHLAQGFHDLDGIRLLIESEAREGEWDQEGRLEIEREGGRDGVIEGVTRGRPQRVE